MTRCPRCRGPVDSDELPDGLPGILYDICNGCGWTRAASRTRQDRHAAAKRREERDELTLIEERKHD